MGKCKWKRKDGLCIINTVGEERVQYCTYTWYRRKKCEDYSREKSMLEIAKDK